MIERSRIAISLARLAGVRGLPLLAVYALMSVLATLVRGDVPDLWVPLGPVRARVAPGRGELVAFAEVWGTREYEPVADLLAGPGCLVVDVGANVGAYTLLQLSRGARVIAIEPDPEPRRRLQRAVEAAGWAERAEILAVAVGTRPRRATLSVGRSTPTAALGAIPARPVRRHEVEVVSLDDALAASRQIDIMKIDVEGDVADVVRSGPRSLTRTRSIVLEYHSNELLREIRSSLSSLGFHETSARPWIASYRRVAP